MNVTAARRARAFLVDLEVPHADPFAAAALRSRWMLGLTADPEPLLRYWKSREPGSATSMMRYRWDLTHERCTIPSYAGSPSDWRAWRKPEQREFEPFRFEERLSIPILIAETCELLTAVAQSGEPSHELAAELLEEAEPVFRRDFALYIQAQHSFVDTFALWCLVRRRRALGRLHPFAIAIAACYAPGARRDGGVVLGTRYPFHGDPLVSASAQLAAGLVSLGTDLDLVSMLVGYVRATQRASGGWGDPTQLPGHDGKHGEEDVLTSLVAADLLTQLDPSFDPASAIEFFASRQEENGAWRALGPEIPWLTLQIVLWLEASMRPFSDRFRWPYLAPQNKDHKTNLPAYSYFADLARLYTDLPGLAAAETEIAFIDLAGFGKFNNRYGQDLGDAVLSAFAAELGSLTGARAIRDGGDEFLVVGAPGRARLVPDLDHFRELWPARFRARFGDDAPPVAPRILVAKARGRALRRAREALGRGIGRLKEKDASPPPTGVLSELQGQID